MTPYEQTDSVNCVTGGSDGGAAGETMAAWHHGHPAEAGEAEGGAAREHLEGAEWIMQELRYYPLHEVSFYDTLSQVQNTFCNSTVGLRTLYLSTCFKCARQ